MRARINDNGMVEYIMQAGSDYVHGYMTVEDADGILCTGTITTDNETHHGFTLCVDGSYWFIPASEKKSKKE